MTNKSKKECPDCGRLLDGKNCPAGGVHDTPKPEVGQREEGWQEEFDEKYANEWKPGHRHNEHCEFVCCLRNDIKSFVSQVLSHQRQELIEKVEKMIHKRIDSLPSGSSCSRHYTRDLYWVLKLIRLIKEQK